MPKLKKTSEEVIKNTVRANLRYIQSIQGLDLEGMASIIYVSSRTMGRRLKDPGDLTLNELIRFANRAKIPITSLFTEKGN